jgi:hypothetical protein
VHFTVQAMDKTKRLSKQRVANLADKQYEDQIRRSIEKSNLTRQEEFKKVKKNQKKTGSIFAFICFYVFFYSIRKKDGTFRRCIRFYYSTYTNIDF